MGLKKEKESIDTDISRAVNIAVDTAMDERAWMDRVSLMNTDSAKKEFRSYLHENMGLNRENKFIDSDGNMLYQLIITEEEISESPAEYKVTGTIRMSPALLGNFYAAGFTFDLPFSEKSRNQRFD